jgi:ornithine cyclodeaminase
MSSGFSGVDPPALDGLVVVFDARNGSPVAFLLDGGFVTDQRTGAAGGVAARWPAPERVEVAAVIGSGVQARKQVEALRVLRPQLREIRVWGRDPARAARAASDVGGVVAATVAEAARAADVVITCTASRADPHGRRRAPGRPRDGLGSTVSGNRSSS